MINLIALFLGLGAVGAVATFSTLASLREAKAQAECAKLEGCRSRELEIAMKKVRGR